MLLLSNQKEPAKDEEDDDRAKCNLNAMTTDTHCMPQVVSTVPEELQKSTCYGRSGSQGRPGRQKTPGWNHACAAAAETSRHPHCHLHMAQTPVSVTAATYTPCEQDVEPASFVMHHVN